MCFGSKKKFTFMTSFNECNGLKMTFGDELSLTHCGTSHFKLFFQNVKSVNFNKGYGFWLLI